MPNKYVIIAKDRNGRWWQMMYAYGEHGAIKARDDVMKKDDIILARYELM